jgi:hypothetical protein
VSEPSRAVGRFTNGERSDRNILVPEAHALGAIGVIRSLGRAGYRVHAISPQPDALGFESNFATTVHVTPPYWAPEFLAWLEGFLREQRIDLIIPSEGFLLAVRPVFESLKPLLPVPDRADTVYRAFSKVAVAEALLGGDADPIWRDMLPPTLIVRRGASIPSHDAIASLGAPYYVKSDASLNRRGQRALLGRCDTVDGVVASLSENLDAFDSILVQGFVPGVKAAVAFCLDARGDIVTQSGVLGLHTTPHQGGMMSLRESWWHPRMAEVGLAWLRHLDWRGVAMIECKWDPATDRFWLIEINARYWGYLHLDLYAGVDVPRLQADRFFALAPGPVPPARLGVRCRHAFPGDAGWLISRIKDRTLSPGAKLGSALEYCVDFVDFTCHADLSFPGDRRLYWIEASRYARSLSLALLRRTQKSSGTD